MDKATLSTHYFNVKGLEPCRNEVKTVISLLRSLSGQLTGSAGLLGKCAVRAEGLLVPVRFA